MYFYLVFYARDYLIEFFYLYKSGHRSSDISKIKMKLDSILWTVDLGGDTRLWIFYISLLLFLFFENIGKLEHWNNILISNYIWKEKMFYF